MFDEAYQKLITECGEGGNKFTPGFLRALRNVTAQMLNPETAKYAVKKICSGCQIAILKNQKGGSYPKLCPYCSTPTDLGAQRGTVASNGEELVPIGSELNMTDHARQTDFDPINSTGYDVDKAEREELVGDYEKIKAPKKSKKIAKESVNEEKMADLESELSDAIGTLTASGNSEDLIALAEKMKKLCGYSTSKLRLVSQFESLIDAMDDAYNGTQQVFFSEREEARAHNELERIIGKAFSILKRFENK